MHLTDVQCTKPYAAGSGEIAELRLRIGVETPVALWHVFVWGVRDIKRGDTITFAFGKEYVIRDVTGWADDPATEFAYTHLICEEVQP